MFECSPVKDGGEAVRLDRFGRKGHEMVSVDPDGKAIYHTEDAGGSDRFYRTVFDDAAWPDGGRPDMSQGVLQVLSLTGFGDDSNYDSTAALAAARIGPTPITWLNAVDDGSPQEDVRLPQSTEFVGNEGVWYLDGFIFFSTKSDNNIWAIDRDGNTVESIFDGDGQEIQGSFADPSEPEMFGVDNIAMTLDGEMLIVEDGGDMRCMVRLPDGRTIPLLRLPGNASLTEVTGVAISPAGDKIYVSGQRSLRNGVAPGTPATAGITYEITMPFTVRVDRPLAQAMPVS
jgi:secreted PhoX family phosphatase